MQSITYKDGIRSLSNIFNPSTIRQVINDNDLSYLSSRINKYRSVLFQSNEIQVFKSLLAMLYSEMNKNYRNEYIYKNTLINKLLFKKYSLASTTLLNEFKIGSSKADTVLVNGEVKLYEIKTDLDSLSRLDNQLSDYKKAVEKIYIITNTKYIKTLKEKYLYTDYGIIELTSNQNLKTHKDATENKDFFNHLSIFKTLRKSEYISIINEYFNNIPNVPNTKIFKECFMMAQKIDIKEFQKLAFEKLKKRVLRCPKNLNKSDTPKELKYIWYTMNLNLNQYNTLYNLLGHKI